jgi:uncharacterized membrane protein YeaQ/YmgE (transglycosylase-associated protein family)
MPDTVMTGTASAGFIMSVIGAMVQLALYHLLVGRRSTAG